MQHVVEPLDLDRAVDREVGRAPRGSSPASDTSTVTVPFCTAGSMRITLPLAMPLRVSIAAGCPMVTSLACVSGMRSTALSRPGSTIRASVAPLWAHWPTSSGNSWRMPLAPAFTTIERTRPRWNWFTSRRRSTCAVWSDELRVGGLRHHRQALLLDLVAGGQLLHLVAGPAGLVGRNELLGHQRFGRLGVPLGVEIGGAGARDLGFLREPLRGEVGAKVDLVGTGDGELALGFERLELHVGIAQLEQHGLRLHLLPRLRQPPLHPSGGDRRDVADPLGHQGSRTTDLDDQRAALDRVDPDGRAVHARAAGLSPRRPSVASTIAASTRPL